jgi:hypothetical protein
VQSTTEALGAAGPKVSDQVASVSQSAGAIGQKVSEQVASVGQSAQSSMENASQFAGSSMEQQSDLLSADQGEADMIAAVILEAIEEEALAQGESSLPDLIILQEENPQILMQDNPFSDVESAKSSEYFSE